MSRIPASMQKNPVDPVEMKLRAEWHKAKHEWEADGKPDNAPSKRQFDFVNKLLSDHLWNRTQKNIEEDRKKHPKAKRNAPVGSASPGGGGRFLP